MYTSLPHRAVLKLTGKDVRTFLQGLLTRNVNDLREDNPLYALMLTPQGKFLYDFFVVQRGEDVLLEYYLPLKEEILSKLRMYKLRADVVIEETALPVFAVGGDDTTQGYTDPRHPALGKRSYQQPEGQLSTLADYDALRISLTIPDCREDMPSGDCFPLFYRMDELHAVDFDKGCYVGQEVTTRSKHRGNIRRTLVTLAGDSTPPAHGTAIMADGKRVGELLSQSGFLALGLLEKDALSLPLSADGMTLQLR